MGEFSFLHWAIVLLIVITVFGTRRLRNVGSDLGNAIRQFKQALHGDDEKQAGAATEAQPGEHPSTPPRTHGD